MSRFLSVLAGTTALVSLSSAAFAADMDPVRAVAPAPIVAAAFEPPPPVVNCKDKKGYYIVPNSNTCLKIIGLIRAQIFLHENTAADDSWEPGDVGAVGDGHNLNDTYSAGTAMRFGADTVTQTDYGALRGNITLQADAKTNGDTSKFAIRYAYVEWAGITAGHKESFFGPDGAIGGYGSAVGDFGGNRVSMLGYTANFSKEVSASIAIEDHDAYDGGDGDFAKGGSEAFISDTPVATDRTYAPELVGNVVGKFDWGLLFASGALGNYNATTATNKAPPAQQAQAGVVDSYIGYAVGLGGNVNLDALGKGDAVQAKFAYSDGAAGHLSGWGDDTAVYDTTTLGAYSLNSTSGWVAQGSFQHHWSPTWTSTAYGGYASANRNPGGALASTEGKVNDAWNLAANLEWSPVENYTIGGEIFYANVTKQAAANTEENFDAVGSIFRVQRSF